MIKRIFNDLVNYVFMIFITVTLWGAIRSENFDIRYVSPRFIFLILVLLFGISIYYSNKKARHFINDKLQRSIKWFMKNIRFITLVGFILLVLAQVSVLLIISMPLLGDMGALFDGAKFIKESPEIINFYLSYNPNNGLFFFIMHGLSQIANAVIPGSGNTWIFWQVINIILLDLGFVILFLAAKKLFNEKVAYLSFYLIVFSLMFSPWMMVPYTDTFMIPVTATVFYLYATLITSQSKKLKIVVSVLLGMMVGLSFLLKPSSIVYLIAWILVKVVQIIDKPQVKKGQWILILFCLFTFVGTISTYKMFTEKQNIVVIDKEMSKPWTHFVMMGVTGNGGYSNDDTNMVNSIPTQKEKKDYTTKMIKERVSDMGFYGYIQFLLKKHIFNTANGDFNGDFNLDKQGREYHEATNSWMIEFLRDTYLQGGERTKNLRFMMQILWIITILGLLFSYKYSSLNNTQLIILKLSIIGAFSYLLIFEGGRSRYLIQYLPIFYLLAANGYYSRCYLSKKEA